MSLRPPAGFIRPGYDPLEVPNAPTDVSASAGDASASVTFTTPADAGGSAITAYYAVSNPGQITGTGASSPVSVTGLTNGTSYTFSVWALNSYGPSGYSGASGSVTPALQRGLFGGGNTGSDSNIIDYVNISSTGNATDFGDLTVARYRLGACASSTRGIWGGGDNSNVIDYVTIASTGNATDFGDLNQNPEVEGPGSCSSSTRGLFGGGYLSGTGTLQGISYITIASAGNSTNFGNLTTARYYVGACASSTRGVFAGGSSSNVIDYVTIASTGNATDFGDLLAGTYMFAAGCSNSTRGLFGGGDPASNVIQYITIASTGNATDFGDLLTTVKEPAACASSVRALWGGGTGPSNVIAYVTITSTGNATDFGDLTSARYGAAACSNAHGGL